MFVPLTMSVCFGFVWPAELLPALVEKWEPDPGQCEIDAALSEN